MSNKLFYIKDPAFRYCNYCAAEDSYVIVLDTIGGDYIACVKCFNAAAARAGHAAHYWNDLFKQHGRRELLKALYEDPNTDEKVKTAIMAEVLGR